MKNITKWIPVLFIALLGCEKKEVKFNPIDSLSVKILSSAPTNAAVLKNGDKIKITLELTTDGTEDLKSFAIKRNNQRIVYYSEISKLKQLDRPEDEIEVINSKKIIYTFVETLNISSDLSDLGTIKYDFTLNNSLGYSNQQLIYSTTPGTPLESHTETEVTNTTMPSSPETGLWLLTNADYGVIRISKGTADKLVIMSMTKDFEYLRSKEALMQVISSKDGIDDFDLRTTDNVGRNVVYGIQKGSRFIMYRITSSSFDIQAKKLVIKWESRY